MVKANMIVEREQMFSKSDLKSKELFPSYIIIRKQLDPSQNEESEVEALASKIKKAIKKQSIKMK